MRLSIIIGFLLFTTGFFRISGQNLRIPVNRKLVTDTKGNFQQVKLLITETGISSGILFSEIHQPRPDSSVTYYLLLGTGEQQSGNLPVSFTHPEKWEISIQVKDTSTKTFLPVISVPLNLVCGKCWFQAPPEKTAKQNLRISMYGDTIFAGDNNHFLLYSGVSTANYTRDGESANSSHSCGVGEVHNPALTYGRMKDQEGNEYKTIRIGMQEWMAENLRVSSFRNGDLIEEIRKKKDWKTADSPAFCWYDNDSAQYECPYGKLYNALVVNDNRNICPTGWHVPDKKDWNNLIGITGGGEKSFYSLKTSDFRYWAVNGFFSEANKSGFSALPAAARYFNGKFGDFANKYGIGYYGFWWSSDKKVEKQTGFCLNSEYRTDSSIDEFLQEINPNCGLSIRCIRDEQK